MTTIETIKMNNLISKNDKGEFIVSSLTVAEVFGRPHHNVLRSIDSVNRQLLDIKGEITIDFSKGKGTDGISNTRTAFLNERQFLMVMPFIGGKKALQGQIRLVDEFIRLRTIEQGTSRHIDAIRSLLLLDAPCKWVKLYPDSFYIAIMNLYGHGFDKAKNKPFYCAQITRRWIYDIVLPVSLQIEIDTKKGDERKFQWFNNEGGRETLIRQIAIVQTLAETSDNRADFESRCARKFLGEPLQLTVFK